MIQSRMPKLHKINDKISLNYNNLHYAEHINKSAVDSSTEQRLEIWIGCRERFSILVIEN